MRMKRAFRGVITAPLVVVWLLAAAPADAQRPHIPYNPGPNPTVLPQGDYCDDFTAIVTFTRLNQYIIQDTTAQAKIVCPVRTKGAWWHLPQLPRFVGKVVAAGAGWRCEGSFAHLQVKGNERAAWTNLSSVSGRSKRSYCCN